MLRVVDLFSGLGGFSAGAVASGAAVELVIDNDHIPLKLLAANVPDAKVKLATLGPGGDRIEFLPEPAPNLHVHASSPCTELSSARMNATTADIESGLGMLKWCLDLVLGRGDWSGSLENVSTIQTRALLQEYAEKYPRRVSYATLDAVDFGAAQTRLRLIAGPPKLINALKEMPAARRISVREAFANRGLETPSQHFKNQTRARGGGPSIRSCEGQSFTVCASHALTWCNRDGTSVRVMTSAESAILMGFPSKWRLPHGARVSQRAVGNALCVEMSKAIVEAAMKIHATAEPTFNQTDTIQPTINTSNKRSMDDDDTAHSQTEGRSASVADDLHKILKRLKRMERAMIASSDPSVKGTPDRDADVRPERGALVHTSGDLGAGGADQLGK